MFRINKGKKHDCGVRSGELSWTMGILKPQPLKIGKWYSATSRGMNDPLLKLLGSENRQ